MQIAIEPPMCGVAPEMREQLAAAIANGSTRDYVSIRAIVAAGCERDDRVARLTAMGREFVTDVRRRARTGGVTALLAEPPSLHERVLESATRQIVADDGRELVTMQRLSRDSGIPRRTLYNLYAANELDAACRRRSQTIWRARFEHAVLTATADPKRRLFAVVDALDAWVASRRFRVDQALSARASITERLQDDDVREHLAEIDRFATALAVAARLASPGVFAAFVATSVAGAVAWYDRRAAARAASIVFVEREIARRR
jgi:AcrR family transcriptional regulator